MSDGGAQAAPGWYPDPYQPSRLRYWDGAQWTDHFHEGGSDGSLPSIGDWLGSTFSAIGAYGIPALILAVGGSLLVNIITSVMLDWSVTDQAIIDEEFVGSVSSLVTRLGLLALIVAFVQGVVWLAVNRFMQRAHLQADPTVGEAVTHAVKRTPRLIAVTLLLIIGAVLVFAVTIGLAALTQNGIVVGLVVLLLIPFAFWAFVKISFLSAAVVAAPTSTSAVRASMSVSKGRFWGVFGRLLLVTIGIAVVSGTAGAALGGLGSPVDQDAFNDIFIAAGDSPTIRDFSFQELLPSAGSLIPYIIVNSILNAATGLISTSAFMRLYLDSGAPSEL